MHIIIIFTTKLSPSCMNWLSEIMPGLLWNCIRSRSYSTNPRRNVGKLVILYQTNSTAAFN